MKKVAVVLLLLFDHSAESWRRIVTSAPFCIIASYKLSKVIKMSIVVAVAS